MTETARTPLTARGSRSPREWPTIDTWQDAPFNRWAFTHVEEFVTSVNIARAGAIAPTEDGLSQFGTRVQDLEARLAATWTDAFLVVRNGTLVGEWYAPGIQPRDRHLLMSVSKSICGIVMATLIDDGLIDPAATVAHYVPDLSESAFGTATVQQVLDMEVAVEYNEDYADLNSHVRAHDRVAGWRSPIEGEPANTYEFLRGLRSSGPHGVVFQYCSANTDVLAWIAEAVTGTRYHELLSERVWSHLGCDSDAAITVDSVGFAFANGGISCTARDLARIGELMLNDGLVGDHRVVSSDWVRSTMAGGDPDVARGLPHQVVHPNGSYKNQWWATGNARGNVYAAGIHGQYIWLDVPTQTVVVKMSSAPEALSRTMTSDHAQLFRDVCSALEG